jgi:hypothetical protein
VEVAPHVTPVAGSGPHSPGPFSRAQRIAIFMALACVPAWSLAAVLSLRGIAWSDPAARVIPVVYGFTPAFAALLTKLAIFRERRPEDLGLMVRADRWLALAWVLAPVTLLLAVGAAWCMPGAELKTAPADFWEFYRTRVPDSAREAFEAEVRTSLASGTHPALRFVLAGLVGGVLPGALLKLGTELGWRGFIHSELADLREAPRAAITGALTVLWIAPLALQGYFFAVPSAAAAAALGAALFAQAFVLERIRTLTGAVVGTALFLGVVDAVGPITTILVPSRDPWVSSVYGFAGAVALSAVAALLWVIRPAPRIRSAASEDA